MCVIIRIWLSTTTITCAMIIIIYCIDFDIIFCRLPYLQLDSFNATWCNLLIYVYNINIQTTIEDDDSRVRRRITIIIIIISATIRCTRRFILHLYEDVSLKYLHRHAAIRHRQRRSFIQ